MAHILHLLLTAWCLWLASSRAEECTPVGTDISAVHLQTDNPNQTIATTLPSVESIVTHGNTSDNSDRSGVVNCYFSESRYITSMKKVFNTHVIFYICLFGIIGNILNLVILTRKSLTTDMERMEKSSHVGLIALAVSDLLFCITILPNTFEAKKAIFHSKFEFWLLQNLYSNAVINTFMLSSTWLTVAMAVSRYIAICYPLKARQHLGVTAARYVICLVFIFSLLLNLPRFWDKVVEGIDCQEGYSFYWTDDGPMKSIEIAAKIYNWLYFIFGILIPFIVLVYCNIYLIKALKVSLKLRKQTSTRGGNNTKDAVSNSKNIVTLSLTIIVIFYMVLVSPAEVLRFWELLFSTCHPSKAAVNAYSLAISVCNALQTVNFAINFILYCIINVHFRKVMKELITCIALRQRLQNRPSFICQSDGEQPNRNKVSNQALQEKRLLPHKPNEVDV